MRGADFETRGHLPLSKLDCLPPFAHLLWRRNNSRPTVGAVRQRDVATELHSWGFSTSGQLMRHRQSLGSRSCAPAHEQSRLGRACRWNDHSREDEVIEEAVERKRKAPDCSKGFSAFPDEFAILLLLFERAGSLQALPFVCALA